MQAADAQQNEEDLELQGQLAQIGTRKTTTALGTIEKQKSDLNAWNMAEAQRAAAAREAELQRQFTARENAANRSFQASQSALTRAAAAPTGPTRGQIVDNLNSWASKRVGGDKKLSPSDFKAGYQQAARDGMGVEDYVAVMQKYINTRHSKDYNF